MEIIVLFSGNSISGEIWLKLSFYKNCIDSKMRQYKYNINSKFVESQKYARNYMAISDYTPFLILRVE